MLVALLPRFVNSPTIFPHSNSLHVIPFSLRERAICVALPRLHVIAPTTTSRPISSLKRPLSLSKRASLVVVKPLFIRSISQIIFPSLFDLLDDQGIYLDAVRKANGDINEIRMLLKGNKEACLRLFRQAVAAEDFISQIQLSQVFYAMKWSKDMEKKFPDLKKENLEKYDFFPHRITIFNLAFDRAYDRICNEKVHKERGEKVFEQAEKQGYLPKPMK